MDIMLRGRRARGRPTRKGGRGRHTTLKDYLSMVMLEAGRVGEEPVTFPANSRENGILEIACFEER